MVVQGYKAQTPPKSQNWVVGDLYITASIFVVQVARWLQFIVDYSKEEDLYVGKCIWSSEGLELF